jgi:hypothetical protein
LVTPDRLTMRTFSLARDHPETVGRGLALKKRC